LAASWSEIGKVYIWDLTDPLSAVSDPKAMTSFTKKQSQYLPLFTFNGHQSEGFAIDWSPIQPGQLATGDSSGSIHCWSMESENSRWLVDQRPFSGHTASVEDIQWSPNEPTVFASCSADKSIRVFDTRAMPAKANMVSCLNAHNSDVNVINWNRSEPFIASGGDDSAIKIWDLRLFAVKLETIVLNGIRRNQKFLSRDVTLCLLDNKLVV
jgi:ribosome assembly protein RRB1